MNASKASKRKKEETIWSDLRRDVRRHGRMWEAGRARRPELAPFEDAGALVAVLERRGESDAARRAVLCALVREHRLTAHPLWQGLLLVAFEPMVRSLRASLARREGRDATQAAILAFLEGLGALPDQAIGPFLPLAIVRAARRAASLTGPRQSRWARPVPLDEQTVGVVEPEPQPGQPLDSGLLAQAIAASPPELVPVLLARYGGDESLSAYVDRVYVDRAPRERRGIYERLVRQHRAVLDIVQSAMVDEAYATGA